MKTPTIKCTHTRRCKCLEKALALANKTGEDVLITTREGNLRVTRKENP